MKEKKSNLKKTFEYFFSAIIILALLLVILWGLFFYKVIPTPSFLSFVFNPEDKVDSSYYDESRFYDFLEERSDTDTEVRTHSIDYESVARFIEAVKVKDNYYWEIDVTNYYKDDDAVFSHTVWASDGKVRIDTVSQYSNTSTVVSDGGVTVRNNYNGKKETVNGDTEQALKSVVNIADIELYMSSEYTEMKDAGLIDTDTEKYLYVSFYTESLDKLDEFYVSLDFGVVLFASSEINSEKVFSQTTRDFRNGYRSGPEIFKI